MRKIQGAFPRGKRWKAYGKGDPVVDLSFSRDGSKILSVATMAATGFFMKSFLRAWDRDKAKGRIIGGIETWDSTGGVAFSADDKLIIQSNGYGSTRMWKADSREFGFQSGCSTTIPQGLSDYMA